MTRFIVFLLLFYLLYKLLKNLFTSQKKTGVFNRGTTPPQPPPYDPNSVEDIDYEEVKEKKTK